MLIPSLLQYNNLIRFGITCRFYVMAKNEMQWSSATPGLLIILLDQSGSMMLPYEGNESKTVFASKAVNRVIDNIIQKNFDGDAPKNRCFISVIGYSHIVKELCSGWLKDLDSNPIRLDEIKQKVPDGAGGIIEINKKMPIWVEPITHDGATNMKGAFELAKDLSAKWMQENPKYPVPVIINISDGVPYYNGLDPKQCMLETNEVAQSIMQMENEDGNVLIFNAHIEKDGGKIEYPDNEDSLRSNEAKFLFGISSKIPAAYIPAAKKHEISINENSRACVFEADGVQLIQLIDFGSSKGQGDNIK